MVIIKESIFAITSLKEKNSDYFDRCKKNISYHLQILSKLGIKENFLYTKNLCETIRNGKTLPVFPSELGLKERYLLLLLFNMYYMCLSELYIRKTEFYIRKEIYAMIERKIICGNLRCQWSR